MYVKKFFARRLETIPNKLKAVTAAGGSGKRNITHVGWYVLITDQYLTCYKLVDVSVDHLTHV